MSLEYLSGPLAELWLQALAHFLWQGTALAALVMVLLKLVAPRTPQGRYVLYLMGLCAMAICPLVTFLLLCSALPVDAEIVAASEFVLSNESIVQEAADIVLAPSAANPQAWEEVARPWILGGWISGVAVLLARLVLSWIGMILVTRPRASLAVSQLHSITARLAARLGMRRVPVVRASSRVTDAAAVGFWRPIILLPAAWVTELPPDMLEAVIAHELAHIRRFDLWWNLLQRVVETVLFYHPAVWWLSQRVRAERECCCDELAVSATHQRLVYATTLEFVARRQAGLVRPLVAVTLGDTDMALLQRVRQILGLAPATGGGWGAIVLLAIVIPVTFWLPTGASVPAVQADEEQNVSGDLAQVRETERREGERREPERRDEIRKVEVRRDGDRPQAERREGDARSRPEPQSGRGEVRVEIRRGPEVGPRGNEGRPGERRVEESRDVRREGDRIIVEEHRREENRGPNSSGGPRPPFGPGNPGPLSGNRQGPPVAQEMGEMMRVIADLRREVEQLRNEVRELKGQRSQGPQGPGMREGNRFSPDRPDQPGRQIERPTLPGQPGGDRPGMGPGRGPQGPPAGNRPQDPPRDSDRRPGSGPQPNPRGPADAPRANPGARDGNRPAGAPRDGDRPSTGPRDGDRPNAGPRDADRPQNQPRGPRDGERREGAQRDGERREGERREEGAVEVEARAVIYEYRYNPVTLTIEKMPRGKDCGGVLFDPIDITALD